MAEVAAALGLHGPGVGMMTAADVAAVATARDEGVGVEATVGLTQPLWAAARRRAVRRGRWPPAPSTSWPSCPSATATPRWPTPCTATEAKAQALFRGGVEGTGTASDAVTVVCPATGRAEPFGGPARRAAPRWPAPSTPLSGGDGGPVITLVLGGTRSGKSAVAERLTARHASADHLRRHHGAGRRPRPGGACRGTPPRRDPAWQTVEAGEDLPGLLAKLPGTVLVDSLGPWVARRGAGGADGESPRAALRRRDGRHRRGLRRGGPGGAPFHRAGAALPRCARLGQPGGSAVADRVFLVVAGRALALPPVGPPP